MKSKEAYEIIEEIKNKICSRKYVTEQSEAFDVALELLKQEPCEDAISRQAVLDQTYLWSKDEFLRVTNPFDYLRKRINSLSPVNPQSETGQFAKWVATEIFDDNWEYNKDAFAEIACRKLAKLGIVRAKGGEWELVEPQENEEVC